MTTEITKFDPATAGGLIAGLAKMADVLEASRVFGDMNQAQIIALMLAAHAEGIHPVAAMRRYHIIKGKAALRADAILADFQTAGGHVSWDVYTDTEVRGTFRSGESSVTVSWTPDQARRAGLDMTGMWARYPRAMMRSRCIAEGVRATMPGVITGMITVEEAEEAEDTAPVVMATVVRAAVVGANIEDAISGSSPKVAEKSPEVVAPSPPARSAQPAALKKLHTMLGKLGVGADVPAGPERESGVRAKRLDWVALVIGHRVASSSELTPEELKACIDVAEADLLEQEEQATEKEQVQS